jgi:hypothetical protein
LGGGLVSCDVAGWLSRLDATRLGGGMKVLTHCVLGNHFVSGADCAYWLRIR